MLFKVPLALNVRSIELKCELARKRHFSKNRLSQIDVKRCFGPKK